MRCNSSYRSKFLECMFGDGRWGSPLGLSWASMASRGKLLDVPGSVADHCQARGRSSCFGCRSDSCRSGLDSLRLRPEHVRPRPGRGGSRAASLRSRPGGRGPGVQRPFIERSEAGRVYENAQTEPGDRCTLPGPRRRLDQIGVERQELRGSRPVASRPIGPRFLEAMKMAGPQSRQNDDAGGF